MKIKLLGVIFCCFTAFGLRAQVSGASQNCKQQAEKMGAAFVRGEYATVAKYTYPVVLQAMGGADKMAAGISKMMASVKEQGMTFKGITVDQPTKIVKSGTELQATVPQHTEIKMKQGRMVATSTLIGISKDNGVSWTFLDTSNKNMAMIKQVLPSLSPSLTIPAQQTPVRYND